MATYARGISLTGLPTYGLVQNVNEDNEIEFATAEDEDGEVAVEDSFNAKTSFKFEYVYDTEISKPAPGTNITISGETYVIDKVGDVKENKGFRKVTIECHQYLNLYHPTT